jgi:periplasmic protein CpxP/Spy
MKRLVMFFSLLIMVAVMAVAQDGRPAGGQRPNMEERMKQQMETMKKELNLTADQVTKVEALNAETGKKMQELFQNNSGDREQQREKMRAVREENDKKLKAILNADQYKKWEAIQEKQRQERQANRPQGQGGPGQGGPGGQRGGERGGQR